MCAHKMSTLQVSVPIVCNLYQQSDGNTILNMWIRQHLCLFLGHPMKPHRLAVTHSLVFNYGLHKQMKVKCNCVNTRESGTKQRNKK
jgi:hypothetical protein